MRSGSMSDPVNACPRCGAPFDGEGDRSGRCPFCGAKYDLRAPAATDPDRELAGLPAPRVLGGSLFVAAFGVLWTFAALSIGAPVPFALFGLVFSGFAVFIGMAARRAARSGRVGRRPRGVFDDSDVDSGAR
jgi:hypothetical protein